MASFKVANATAELAAALDGLVEPISNATIVLQMIVAIHFRSRSAEHELASAISNAAVTLKDAAREQKKLGDSILAGVRMLHERALALAEQEDEK